MRNIFSLAILLHLFACQNSSPSSFTPKIFAKYYVRYLESEQFIKAEAQFSEGDSLQNAQPIYLEKSPKFQGIEMGQKPLKKEQIKYNFENVGEYPKDFKFTSEDKKAPKEISIGVLPIKDFLVNDCSLKNGLEIEFSEIPIIDNQQIIIFIKDSKGASIFFEIDYATAQKNLKFSFRDSQNLQIGTGQLLMIKKEHKTIQQDNFVIESILEYYSKGQEITIVE